MTGVIVVLTHLVTCTSITCLVTPASQAHTKAAAHMKCHVLSEITCTGKPVLSGHSNVIIKRKV